MSDPFKSDPVSGEKRVDSPRQLSPPGLFALAAGLCVVPALAGAVAQEVGGWLGLIIGLVAWGLLVVVSWAVTCRFANPIISTLCGTIIGVTIPRPSDEWVRQVGGMGSDKAIEIVMTAIGVAIGLTIFRALAKRHHPFTMP